MRGSHHIWWFFRALCGGSLRRSVAVESDRCRCGRSAQYSRLTTKGVKLTDSCDSEAVSSLDEKASWRLVAKGRREKHRPRRVERDRALVDHLETWLVETVEPSSVVVLFDALPGEPDLSALKTRPALVAHDVSFALTRTPDIGFDLTVHPIDSVLEDHRFGYRQPVAGSPQVADDHVTAVLVPALAFDRHGNRLGFGAGYYDRFLARMPVALKVGIADVLVDERLPVESFDVPMTHLATIDSVHQIEPAIQGSG